VAARSAQEGSWSARTHQLFPGVPLHGSHDLLPVAFASLLAVCHQVIYVAHLLRPAGPASAQRACVRFSVGLDQPQVQKKVLPAVEFGQASCVSCM